MTTAAVPGSTAKKIDRLERKLAKRKKRVENTRAKLKKLRQSRRKSKPAA